MVNLKNNKGITLVALVITIIILLIIASISVYEGKKLIKQAKIQTLETNLLAIRAKAKEYGENVAAKNWAVKEEEKQTKNEEEFSNTYKFAAFNATGYSWYDSSYVYFSLNKAAFDNMELTDIYDDDDTEYIVGYNSTDLSKLEVIYKNGVTYNNIIYYTLTDLQQALESE